MSKGDWCAAALGGALLWLAASTGAAQTPVWISDPRTGCKVWNPHPQPNETISWSGDCQYGYAQGSGTLQWFEQGKPAGRYEGEYWQGQMHGRGTYTWANGDRYEGDYHEGKRHGAGVRTWAAGGRYEGQFRDGNANGRGVFTWPDGGRYDGEWRNGLRHGRGVAAAANKDRYDGEYRDGKPNGYGTAILSGRTYQGTWTNGCFRQGNWRAWFEVTAKDCGFE